jgi:hypothetical protein
MLPGGAHRSRHWPVLQHSRDAGDRCADIESIRQAEVIVRQSEMIAAG